MAISYTSLLVIKLYAYPSITLVGLTINVCDIIYRLSISNIPSINPILVSLIIAMHGQALWIFLIFWKEKHNQIIVKLKKKFLKRDDIRESFHSTSL